MKKKRKRLSRKVRWTILAILVALPLFYFSRKAYMLINTIREEKSLRKQTIILHAESEVLRNRIDDYKRGALLEARARDDLGMIKNGDKVYLVPKK